MSDFELKTTLTADGSPLTNAMQTAEKEVQAFKETVSRAGTGSAAAAQAATAAIGAQAGASTRAAGASAAAATAAERAAAAVQKYGVSAGQTAAAMRQLPMQITDMTTSLASGMPVWMVAIQQGGQIKDAFGGIGPAFSALRAAIPPVAAGIVGLAAAAGATVLAYMKGNAEAAGYAKALILTGNAAGTNAGYMADLARNIASVTGTQASAAAALTEMAATGQVAGRDLQKFSAIAVDMERLVGQSVGDTAAIFENLAKAPLEASVRLTEKTNYLTAATYDQIRSLQEQGRHVEAARVAQNAYADAMAQRMPEIQQNLGWIEQAWLAIKEATTGAIDAAANIGRVETAAQRLAALNKEMREAEAERNKPNTIRMSGVFADAAAREQQALRDEAASLNRSLLNKAEQDAAQAAAALTAKAYAKARDENDKWAQAAKSNAEQMDAALKKYRENNRTILDAGGQIDDGRVAREEAAIRKKFEDPEIERERKKAEAEAERARKAAQTDAKQAAEAQRRAEIASIKNDLTGLTGAYGDAERTLEAQRSAGLLSEAEYWQAKRALIALNEQAQLQALQQENATLAAAKATGAEKIRLDAEIAQNTAAMARVRAKASTDVAIANAQEAAGITKLQRAQQEYLQQLREAEATRARQQSRDMATIGRGDSARDLANRQNAVDDRVFGQRQQLDGDRLAGRLSESEYQARLSALQAYHERALQAEVAYQAQRQALEADGTNGFTRALENYLDSARNVAAQTEQLFGRAFQGMEDGIVKFAMTGKASFSDFAESVIADLIRIYVRQQLVGMLSSAVSFFSGATASGGTPINGSAGNSFIPANVAHGGGIIGADSFQQRTLPASAWSGAPRFHTGFAADEYAAVLQRGESVFTSEQLRRLQPAGGSGSVSVNMPVTIHNNNAGQSKVTTRQSPEGGLDVFVDAVEAVMADRVGQGQGPMTQALQGRYGLTPAMS